MEGWVAVTYSDWFDFLARQPHREENFWSPSDYYTFHGTPGAPPAPSDAEPLELLQPTGQVLAHPRGAEQVV